MPRPRRGAGLELYDVQRRRFNIIERVGVDYGHPNWSPDGNRLAFDRGSCDDWNPKPACAIFVSGRDGRRAKRIATNASDPAWSPNGRQIAFARQLGRENTEIYVMNADGTRQRRLTFNPGPDIQPDWQPIR